MQNNPQGQPQRSANPGTRQPLQAKRPPQPLAGNGPAAQSRPTTSFRDDPPPGMGGGEAMQQGGYAQQQAPYSQQPLYSAQPPVQVGSMNVKAFGGIGIGLLLIVGGIAATMISYNSAGNGGTYTIWWGPVLFGGITLLGGIGALFKK